MIDVKLTNEQINDLKDTTNTASRIALYFKYVIDNTVSNINSLVNTINSNLDNITITVNNSDLYKRLIFKNGNKSNSIQSDPYIEDWRIRGINKNVVNFNHVFQYTDYDYKDFITAQQSSINKAVYTERASYYSKGGLFIKRRGDLLITDNYLPIDKDSFFKGSVIAKIKNKDLPNDGSYKCSFHIGLVPYDADKNLITSSMVNIVPNSIVELDEDANSNSRSIKLRGDINKLYNGADGKLKGLAFFKLNNLGNYSYIGNDDTVYEEFKYSRLVSSYYRITDNNDGTFTLDLPNKLGFDIPAGTKVANTFYSLGGWVLVNYMLPINNKWNLAESEWIENVYDNLTYPNAPIVPYGTKYVKLKARLASYIYDSNNNVVSDKFNNNKIFISRIAVEHYKK